MRLTKKRLKEVLNYDPETGIFTRKEARYCSMRVGEVLSGKLVGGYMATSIDGKHYGLQRLAWLYMMGHLPSKQIDHINCIKTDNRWANLRLATRSQNKINSPRYKNNTTGVKGANYSFSNPLPFRSRIGVNGKRVHLGYFATAKEAKAAYSIAAKYYYGEFARTD